MNPTKIKRLLDSPNSESQHLGVTLAMSLLSWDCYEVGEYVLNSGKNWLRDGTFKSFLGWHFLYHIDTDNDNYTRLRMNNFAIDFHSEFSVMYQVYKDEIEEFFSDCIKTYEAKLVNPK